MRPELRFLLRLLACCFAVRLASSAFASPAALAPREAGLQDGSPLFSTLGAASGLPNSSVSSIVQDGSGFLWFGTQGGLARYDGRAFKLFCHEPFDSSSLPHDTVQTLCMDGSALWAGTYGGLARFDLRSEKFVSYHNDPARPDSLSNDVVTAIRRDAFGSLWVGTLSGLNRLDEKGGVFKRFLHDEADSNSLPSDIVRAIFVDREGRLWIGTSGGGLARYDYGADRFIRYRAGGASGSILSDYVMAIDEDSSGGLWIGSWNGGLSRFDPGSGRFENHPSPDPRVYAVCAAENGVVYAGSWGGGLMVYDLATKSYSVYRASGEPGALSHDIVYSLFRDGSGDLWIGTNGGGVSRLDRAKSSLEAIFASPGRLPSGKIYAVLSGRGGELWASSYGKGLVRRDASTGKWRAYTHLPGDGSSLPDDMVNFVQEDSAGEIWAGTHGGLARYDRSSDSFSTYRPGLGSGDPLSSSRVYALAEDRDGAFWIGVYGRGLFRWDRRAPGEGAFTRYAHESGRPDSLSNDIVTALALDASKRLWIGTNRGLNLLLGPGESRGGSFKRYLYDPEAPSGLSSDSINTIFLDSRKFLWIGSSGGGLMRYESATDSFVRYTKRDGLPSNSVVRILEDGSGDLWIATQAGLAVYDRSLGRISSISLSSGSDNAEFFAGACRERGGALLFGAMDRVYRIDPARYKYNDHVPPVELTSVTVKGKPRFDSGELMDLGAGKARIELSWREDDVSFEFAALDYDAPSRNRYSFKLEGFDSDWSDPSSRRSASYTNLPGGDYTFRVKAANGDGLWNDVGIAVPVRVAVAPWASWWAQALYSVLLVVAGFVVARALSRTALYAARAEADGLRGRLVEASASMEVAAIVDGQTGLPNKRKALEHLELAMTRSQARKLELAIFLVDIDRFKAYNDQYGRAAGDECLRKVAGALSVAAAAAGGIVARYGGEEFLAIVEDSGAERAFAIAEALRSAVAALRLGEGGSGGALSVSVGYAIGGLLEGQSPEALVSEAERACMAAKLKGRNRCSS
jgi:diguanylate cyclase (GGDEF) domain